MFKHTLLLFAVMLSAWTFGQDTISVPEDSLVLEWKKIRSYPLDSGEVWKVDALDNIYLTKGSEIVKYDSAGVLKFQQSIKAYGKAAQIEPVNTMKLIYFSEEQQTICFLDNTLSVTEDCVDLLDYDIYNASLIASSARPELLWVYDNVNSTLKLISLANVGEVMQEILNVKGLLSLNDVNQLFESGEKLYLLDREHKIVVLDFYGGLIDSIEDDETQMIAKAVAYEDDLLGLAHNEFKMYPMSEEPFIGKIALPIDGVYEFAVFHDYVYLRTSKFVHKYLPLFHN